MACNATKMTAAIEEWKAHIDGLLPIQGRAFARLCAKDFGQAADAIELGNDAPARYDGINYADIRMAEDEFRQLSTVPREPAFCMTTFASDLMSDQAFALAATSRVMAI